MEQKRNHLAVSTDYLAMALEAERSKETEEIFRPRSWQPSSGAFSSSWNWSPAVLDELDHVLSTPTDRKD